MKHPKAPRLAEARDSAWTIAFPRRAQGLTSDDLTGVSLIETSPHRENAEQRSHAQAGHTTTALPSENND